MTMFKTKLEEFAVKHKNEIRKDPEFRARFHQMCANIGVDPLVSSKVRMQAMLACNASHVPCIHAASSHACMNACMRTTCDTSV